MGYKIELRDRDGTVLDTIGPDSVKTVQLPRTHSKINRWQAVVPPMPSLESYRNPDAFIYYVDEQAGVEELIYRGEFHNPQTPKNGDTTMEGLDVTRKLKRGGPDSVFEATAETADDAIRRYLSQYTPFDPTVYAPTPEVIDDDRLVQEASSTSDLAAVFSPAATTPVTIENGTMTTVQTCFTTEGEDYDRGSQGYFGDYYQPDAYSNQASAGLSWGPNAGGPDYVEYDFTLDYELPADAFDLAVRHDSEYDPQTSEGPGSPAFEWTLQHANGSTYSLAALTTVGAGFGLQWATLGDTTLSGSYDGPALEPGDYTLRCEITDSDGSADLYSYYPDVVAPYDSRFDITLADTVDSDYALPGPETKPDAVSVLANMVELDHNITAVTASATFDDVSGEQALAASIDGGDTYETATNTETLDTSFETYGTTIHGRVTLSRYGTRTGATPTQGYKSQSVSAWELRVTTNDRAVFDQREFSGSHYENIQEMHEDSGRAFVCRYREDALPLVSFPLGAIEAGDVPWAPDVDWVSEDHERSKDSEDYANVLTARGGLDEDGNRLEVTARAEDAIEADDGEIPAPPVFEPKIESRVDLQNLARQELQSYLAEGRLAGSVEIVPKADLIPGVAYPVPELDGEVKVLEEVAFESGGESARGELVFEQSSGLADYLSSISSSVKSVKDTL